MLAKAYANKNQKKNKKNQKNQFPISNSGQNQCQKNQKKNQKKPMPIWKSKKTKKKKPKKTKKNQCQFTDFGVATGFFWVSTPPLFYYLVDGIHLR